MGLYRGSGVPCVGTNYRVFFCKKQHALRQLRAHSACETCTRILVNEGATTAIFFLEWFRHFGACL